MKNWLGSQRSNKNGEYMKGVKTWLTSQATDVLVTDITNSVALVGERTMPTERPPLVGEVSANFSGHIKLIHRYQCLNSGGEPVEK
jgi:hypothetical protein